MKVHELIESLNDGDPDAEVYFAYDYGDHWAHDGGRQGEIRR